MRTCNEAKSSMCHVIIASAAGVALLAFIIWGEITFPGDGSGP